MKGLESPRLLWIYVNDRERLPDHDEPTKDRFRQGSEVQDQAETLFDGVDLNDTSFDENLQQTKRLIKDRTTVFEAGVKHDRLYARTDILKPHKEGIVLIEVKSSTSVKDYHIDDLAFQKHVLEQDGYNVKDVKLIHVNKEYTRRGSIEPDKVLTEKTVTDRVTNTQSGIQNRVKDMLDIIDKDNAPSFNPANIPESTHGNPLIDDFKDDLPDNSVYHLYYAKNKQHSLYDDGIKHLEDIPETVDLTRKQRIQQRVAREDQPHVEPEHIEGFFDDLTYPLTYMDFETMQDAIPLYDDTTPYQQIPFQYSIHIETRNGSIHHKEFIDDKPGDPRPRFLTNLKDDTPETGSIIVWNEWFEKHVLGSLESHCEEQTLSFDRIFDLQDIFKEFWYYHPEQRGSTSLKTVYPILRDPNDVSYDDLNIKKGDEAAIQYKHQRDNPEDELLTNLRRYCGLDTYSMKIIKDSLQLRT